MKRVWQLEEALAVARRLYGDAILRESSESIFMLAVIQQLQSRLFVAQFQTNPRSAARAIAHYTVDRGILSRAHADFRLGGF
jgi:hypothetical protein